MVGNGFFVPRPFLVGFGGMKVGMSMNAPNIIFKPYRALPLYPRTDCHMRNHGPDTVNVALYVSPCCADIERNRSKKGCFFLQETMPCIHGPSLCVCMPALVVAVLIASDYECARKLSASLFLGSQKQAFLASWLWALIVCVCVCLQS